MASKFTLNSQKASPFQTNNMVQQPQGTQPSRLGLLSMLNTAFSKPQVSPPGYDATVAMANKTLAQGQQNQQNPQNQVTQANQPQTPQVQPVLANQTPTDYTSMINQETVKNGQDPYNLQGQTPDTLNRILDSIQGVIQDGGRSNYSDILNGSRQQNGIPSIGGIAGQSSQQINRFGQGGSSYMDLVIGPDGRRFNHTPEGYWQQDQNTGNYNLYDKPGGNIIRSTNPYGGAVQGGQNQQPGSYTMQDGGDSQQGQSGGYQGVIDRSRQQQNIPGLQGQLQDINSQVNNANTAYKYGNLGIQNQAIPQGLIEGQQGRLEQQRQAQISNLVGQQQNIAQQLGIAQGNVGQDIGAAETGGSQAIQQYGNVTQRALGVGNIGLGYAGINKGQYQPYFNPITGEPGTFNQNTGQFQQFNSQGEQGGFQGGQGGNQNYQGPVTSSGQPIPSNIQNMGATDANGTFYINSDKAPTGFNANGYGSANGIPVLNTGDVAAIRGLDATKQNLSRLGQLAENSLSSGTLGRAEGLTKNQADKFLQNKHGQALTAMDTFRESAIKQIQSLASGASGLRINQQVIDTAVSNLPNTKDNLETARVKLNYVNQLLDTQREQILPSKKQGGGQGSNKPSQSQSKQGGSVGWF